MTNHIKTKSGYSENKRS